ncbi:MAG TPA: hypothetical protein VMU50_17030 [Polyangia bacterium]|nr:hypothetical protein [Polyangia bacterium]
MQYLGRGQTRGLGFVLAGCLLMVGSACSSTSSESPKTSGSGGGGGAPGTGGAAGMGSGGTPSTGGNSGSGGSVGPGPGDASADQGPEVASGGDAASDPPGANVEVNPTSANLFMNADFATGLQGWQTTVELKGDSIMKSGAGTILIHGDDAVAAERALDLFQTQMANGKPYLVSFEFVRRNAQGTRPAQVYCQQSDGAKTVYGLSTCTVTNVKATCQATCAPPAGAMVSFGIHAGQSFLDFYVDMASLRQ